MAVPVYHLQGPAAPCCFASCRPRQTDHLWTFKDTSAVWIPDAADDLHLRLCIIAHTGLSGHHDSHSTEEVLSQSFSWSALSADVHSFVCACIYCLSTVRGKKIPRPFGPAFHGKRANDLLQFDYIELGPGNTRAKDVLLLRDDHSDYKWFFGYPKTNAENAATGIIEWCAAFCVPNGLMSDGPTPTSETKKSVWSQKV